MTICCRAWHDISQLARLPSSPYYQSLATSDNAIVRRLLSEHAVEIGHRFMLMAATSEYKWRPSCHDASSAWPRPLIEAS